MEKKMKQIIIIVGLKILTGYVHRKKIKILHKLFFCDKCLNSFYYEESLERHIEYCSTNDTVKAVLPEKDSYLYFKNYKKGMPHPAVFYADFECFTKPVEALDDLPKSSDESSTKQYQKHSPSGFCIKLVCSDGIKYKQKPIIFTKSNPDEDVAQIFVEVIEREVKNFYSNFKFPKKMIFGKKEKKIFDSRQQTVIFVAESL